MKKCPLCGREYEIETKCKSCGVFLIDTETIRAVSENTGKEKHIRAKKTTPADKNGSGCETSGKDSQGNSALADSDPIMAALLGRQPSQKEKAKRKEKAEEQLIQPEAEAKVNQDTRAQQEMQAIPENKTAAENDAVSGKRKMQEEIPESKKMTDESEQDWITEGNFGAAEKKESSSSRTENLEKGQKEKSDRNLKVCMIVNYLQM